MKRFAGACIGVTTLAIGVAVVPMASAGASTAATGRSPERHMQERMISAPRRVNLKAISGTNGAPHPDLAAQMHYFNASRTSASRAAAVRTGGRRSGVIALAAARPPGRSATRTPFALAQMFEDFPLMSVSEQVTLFGAADEAVQPPDTQLAVGPGALVEAVNDSLSAWSKTGNLLAAVDLNLFFSVPQSQIFSDPRLLYDGQSGHWFISGYSFDSVNNSQTYIAVSAGQDPTGVWYVYTVQSNTSSTLTDQPTTGVCDDKVVMAWNEFTGSGATPAYDGAQTLVLQKSALLAGNALGAMDAHLQTTANEFGLVPAQSLSSTATCYMAVNNASTDLIGSTTAPTLGVIAISGTPNAGNVTLAETDVPIAATNPPPDPRQPSGTTNDSQIDDRLVSAVWQGGALWTGATDACTPPGGDTATRDCMRLDKVVTSSPPSLVSDFDVSQVSYDEYYPAVSVDSTGDLFVAYSTSSSHDVPEADAVILTSSGQFSVPFTLEGGNAAGLTASYNGGPTPRWGDYSAAAPDPSLPGSAWVASEYAPSDAGSGNWATAAAEMRLVAFPPAVPAVAIGAEGGDRSLWVQVPQLGSAWVSLGGQISAAPAVAAPPNPGGTTPADPVFIVTGSNGQLWMRSLAAGWQPVGPSEAFCINGPAAVVVGTTLIVACRGTDNALWENSATLPTTGLPAFTTPWRSLGGILSAGPAVAPTEGVVAFFVRGTNGQIFITTEAGGYTPTPWFCIGHPAAALEAAGNDTIFACQGGDRSLWEAADGGDGFGPAVSLGGVLSDGPGIVATAGTTELVVEGSDGSVWQHIPDGFAIPNTGWASLGGIVSGGVGAVALN